MEKTRPTKDDYMEAFFAQTVRCPALSATIWLRACPECGKEGCEGFTRAMQLIEEIGGTLQVATAYFRGTW